MVLYRVTVARPRNTWAEKKSMKMRALFTAGGRSPPHAITFGMHGSAGLDCVVNAARRIAAVSPPYRRRSTGSLSGPATEVAYVET